MDINYVYFKTLLTILKGMEMCSFAPLTSATNALCIVRRADGK
jgi:hypothetical protein